MKPVPLMFVVGFALVSIGVNQVRAAATGPADVEASATVASDASKGSAMTGGLTAILSAAWGKGAKKTLEVQLPAVAPSKENISKPAVDSTQATQAVAAPIPVEDVEAKVQNKPVLSEDDAKPQKTRIQIDKTLKHPGFFVITTIFNPASYQKRYELYHAFVEHMRESGAQLITIEAIFPSLNQTEFQVTDAANPNHIQLTADSVYWVKENLIDEAVERLPADADYVAWIDADVHFHESDWVEQTISSLQNYSVAQLFQYAHFLNAEREILRTDYSFGYSVVRQKPLEMVNNAEWYPHPGYGWAMTRSTFRAIGGLPNYDIVGAGDLYFAYTLVNRIDITIDPEASPQLRHMILEDSHVTYEKLRNVSETEHKANVGFVPVTLSHSWHGSRTDRGYVDRLKILSYHNFDYETDVAKGTNGLLTFVGDDRDELQEDIMCYFQARNEDSTTGSSNRAPCRFMPPGKGVTPVEVDDTRCGVQPPPQPHYYGHGPEHYYGQKTYYTYNVYYGPQPW